MDLAQKVLITAGIFGLAVLTGVFGYTCGRITQMSNSTPARVETKYPNQADIVTNDSTRYVLSCTKKDSNQNCTEYSIVIRR